MFFGGPPRIFKTSPENGQLRIAKNGLPTSATIFCAIRLRHLMLLHLAEICPEQNSKTSPENGQPRIAQNGFSGFWTMFYILPRRNQIHSIMISFS